MIEVFKMYMCYERRYSELDMIVAYPMDYPLHLDE